MKDVFSLTSGRLVRSLPTDSLPVGLDSPHASPPRKVWPYPLSPKAYGIDQTVGKVAIRAFLKSHSLEISGTDVDHNL
jgi:hypothetical protein